MRVSVLASDLAAAMKQSVAPRTSPLGIVEHALLEAENGTLRIVTTDLESTASYVIPATVQEPGAVCAKADLLASSTVVGTELRLEKSADRLLVRGDRRNVIKIPTLPPHEFPTNDAETWTPASIDPLALRDAVERVGYAAASGDIVRKYLNTLFIGNGIVGGSDGYRAAVAPLAYDGPPLLIPIKRALALATLLDEKSTIERVAARKVRVCAGPLTVEVILVALDYPDLPAFFPREASERSFTIWREAISKAVSVIAPFARAASGKGLVRLGVQCSASGEVTLSDRDNNVSDVPGAQDIEGDVDTGVNIEFLRQCAQAASGERVRLSQFERFVVVEPVDGQDRHLLMTMT